MKGLLIKDIRLLEQQKKLLFLYAVMAIVLGYSMDSTFLVSYFPMIGVFLVLSTISLDNFDNGMAFLMTLPISGKLYAVEKYVISLLVTAGTWIIAVALQFVMLMIKKEEFVAAEMLGQDLLFLPVLVFIIVLMIPMDLKFGTEKGRMVLFAVFGIAMILLLGGKAIVEFLSKNAGLDVQGLLGSIKAMPGGAVMAALYGVTIVLLAVSIGISIGIMRKKEY